MRQYVKSILRKCTTCRRVSGMSFLAPEPAPLPKVRIRRLSAIHYQRSGLHKCIIRTAKQLGKPIQQMGNQCIHLL
jgi:hypothetical protein